MKAESGSRCYRSKHRGPSQTSISICNVLGPKTPLTVTDRDKENRSNRMSQSVTTTRQKTGLTVTDLDIRNRLIGSSKSVTSRPQNGPQMLQIETEESLPDFKSQSVTHRTDFPLLLLQVETNGCRSCRQTRLSTSPSLPSPAVGGCCRAVRRIAAALGARRP